MCVALNEINLSNVKKLKQIKYEVGGREYISNAIPCYTVEHFYLELSKRHDSETLITRGFLVLHFDLKQNEALMLSDDGIKIYFEKIIFTQNKFEIVFDLKIDVSIHLCCSLSDDFNIISRAAGFRVNPAPYSLISIESSFFVNANFSYLYSFNMIYTKIGKLKLSSSTLKYYRFKENIISNFDFFTIYDEPIEIPFEMSGSTLGRCDCYFSKKIEKVVIRNCKLLKEVVFITEEDIGRLLFENCVSVSKATFRLNRAAISDRLSLDFDVMPELIFLPEMSAATEKILELPQSVNIYLSHFIPVKRLKRKLVDGSTLPSDYNSRKLEESNHILKNLERAYVLVQVANRQKESLEILEGILIEKRDKKLLERTAEIVESSQSEIENNIKQTVKYFELNHLKSLAYDWVVGYFINLKKILRTFILVVVSFSTLFTFIPTLLKVGTDENGIDITLQQLPMLDRIADSIYFTVVTLTTLGYGDIQPLGWGKLAASILALIGLLLSGTILAVILRRYSR